MKIAFPVLQKNAWQQRLRIVALVSNGNHERKLKSEVWELHASSFCYSPPFSRLFLFFFSLIYPAGNVRNTAILEEVFQNVSETDAFTFYTCEGLS